MPFWGAKPPTKQNMFNTLMNTNMSLVQKLAVGVCCGSSTVSLRECIWRRILHYDTARHHVRSTPSIYQYCAEFDRRAKDAIQQQKESLLDLINSRTTGTESPNPPLLYDHLGSTYTKAVFPISENVWKPEYKISERAHRYFFQVLGITLKHAPIGPSW